jgi:4'-phosphopantetheinyl transferase
MQRLAKDSMHCWVVPAVVSDDRLGLATTVLTIAERERAAKFRRPRDRRLYLASHAALRLLISRYTGHPAQSLRIVPDATGRPVLDGELSRLRFSLSHSGDLALAALAVDEAVGVDVEQVRGFPDVMDVAQRYFASAEAEGIRLLQPDQRPTAFAVTWTRKEAIVKALGVGLAVALESFDTGPAERPASVTGDGARWVNWSVADLRPAPGYVGAVAIQRPNASLAVHQFTWTDTIGESDIFD